MLHPQTVYLQRVEKALSSHVRWLDLGCGRSVCPPWLSRDDELGKALVSRADIVVGLDVDFAALSENQTLLYMVMGDSTELPFRNDAFDFVTSNMVFEHLVNPVETLAEVIRVLRPGGRVIIHTANAGDFISLVARVIPNRFHAQVVSRIEGRAPKRVYPTAYKLNTKAKIQKALRQVGFLHICIQMVESPSLYYYVPLVRHIESLWHMGAKWLPAIRGTIIAEAMK